MKHGAVTQPCSEQAAGWNGWNSHPCRNKGKVERDGKWWCGIHDPVAKDEREAKRGPAKWERDIVARKALHERISLTGIRAGLRAAEEAIDRSLGHGATAAIRAIDPTTVETTP